MLLNKEFELTISVCIIQMTTIGFGYYSLIRICEISWENRRNSCISNPIYKVSFYTKSQNSIQISTG